MHDPVSPLLTPYHRFSPLLTPSHPFSPLLTPAHPFSPLLTPAHPFSPLSAGATDAAGSSYSTNCATPTTAVTSTTARAAMSPCRQHSAWRSRRCLCISVAGWPRRPGRSCCEPSRPRAMPQRGSGTGYTYTWLVRREAKSQVCTFSLGGAGGGEFKARSQVQVVGGGPKLVWRIV